MSKFKGPPIGQRNSKQMGKWYETLMADTNS